MPTTKDYADIAAEQARRNRERQLGGLSEEEFAAQQALQEQADIAADEAERLAAQELASRDYERIGWTQAEEGDWRQVRVPPGFKLPADFRATKPSEGYVWQNPPRPPNPYDAAIAYEQNFVDVFKFNKLGTRTMSEFAYELAKNDFPTFEQTIRAYGNTPQTKTILKALYGSNYAAALKQFFPTAAELAAQATAVAKRQTEIDKYVLYRQNFSTVFPFMSDEDVLNLAKNDWDTFRNTMRMFKGSRQVTDAVLLALYGDNYMAAQQAIYGDEVVAPTIEEAQAGLNTMTPEEWEEKYGAFFVRPPAGLPPEPPQPPKPGMLPVTDAEGNVVDWVMPSALAQQIVRNIAAGVTMAPPRVNADLNKLWNTIRTQGQTPETVKALETLGATPQEISQIFATTEPYRNLVSKFTKLFPVFTDLGDDALKGALTDNLDLYLDTIRFQGRDADTVAFLRALDPTLNPLMRDYEPRLNAFFGTEDTAQVGRMLKQGGVSDVEITKILQQNQLGFNGLNVQPPVPAEGFWQDVGQALYTSTATAAFKTGKFFTSVLPELLYPEEYNQDIRNKFREISANAQSQFDFWVEKHPELIKPEAFEGNPFDNPSLLKDPKYLVYTFAEMLPFTLSILGTSTAVTMATGGNLPLGIAAAFAVATPMQTQDVYDDLLANGAPEDRAALLALPAGMLISSLDSVGNLPLLNVLTTPSKILTTSIRQSVIKQIATNLLKQGVKVTGQELLTETITEDMQQVIQNAVVNAYNKDRSLFDGVGETTIKTLIATAPFALFGGAVSMRGVTPERVSQVSVNERRARGWQQDPISGQWFEPKPLVDMFNEDLHSFEELGLTAEEASAKALNEAAKTPEGASAIARAVDKIKEALAPITPEVTIPQFKMGDKVIYQGEEWEVGFVRGESQDWAGTLRLQKSGEAGARQISMVYPEEVTKAEAVTPTQPPQATPEPLPAVTAEAQAQRVEAGLPAQTWTEAGLQPSMLPEDVAAIEVRPPTKGKLTQISLDDQLKLEQTRRAAETEGLKELHQQDPVANYRFKMGNRNVGLDSLISIREQNFPEYFTVKQAQALRPYSDWSHYTQKGTKDYNHIPKESVLDTIAKELGYDYTGGIDALANRVLQIRAEKRGITELSRSVTMDEIAIEEAEAFQEAVSQDVPPSQAPPPPTQTVTVPRQLPEPARDSEIKRIITQSEEQVRQDQPKVITNLLRKLPGLKQLAEFERPGLKMTGENEKVVVALVAETVARSDVSVWAMGTRLKLLSDIRQVYGKDVLRGAKSDIKFIGTPEQATNPITGTLKDIADNPELYDLSQEQLRVLADINIHNDQLLDWIVSNYGAEIGHWTPKPDGAYLPNVDKGEDVVEWLGSETRAVSQGRGKTRVWATARDRMGGKTPFVPELDVQKLLEGLDDFKSKAAAGQTYKTAIGGLTRLEAMETTHPELFARMTDLKRELTSLRGSKGTLEANIQTAIADFMSSPMEDTDLLNLKDNLDVSLKSGIRKGMDLTDVEGKIGNVQDQIDAIRPAWKVANLKPYVFVQEGLYRYFPADQAQLILESRATTKNRLLGFIEKWRGQAFSGDFSPFTIQGVVGVLADPWGSLKAGAGGVKAIIQHRDLLRSVSIEALADDVANNPVEWGEFASLMGRSLTGVPREYAAGFLSKIPGFDKFTENTFVTVTRGSFNLWQRNYKNMVKHGVPVLEAKVASADIASKVYPLVSQTRLGQSQARHAVLRALPTSYSFIRQPVNLTLDALRGITKLAAFQKLTPSESMAVKVAITGATSTLAVSATSAFISALALGKDDDEAWQAALDAINPHPMNGKFASIIIGNVRIPLGGPYRALFRAFYPAQVKGVPFPVPFAGLPNYARNRITPAIRTQLDLSPAIIGKPEAAVDYNKVQIFNTKDGTVFENILRGLEYEFENFLPLAAGTAAEAIRQGDKYREPMWQQVLGQFMGVNPVTLDNTYIDRQIKQLGLPKETEAKPFTIQKPGVYGAKDLYGDVSSVLGRRTGEGFHDKPLTLAIKEAMVVQDTFDNYLNTKLTNLTDNQWSLLQQRQDLADTTEFDKVNPQLANISRRDYLLLLERESITDKRKLAEFDKEHPELSLNPRQEWLKSHPKENAQLAIWGQAKLLTEASYPEFKRLVKELDIPDKALPPDMALPEESAGNYFKYLEAKEKGSYEMTLMLVKDKELFNYIYPEGNAPKRFDIPLPALELGAKNQKHFDTLAGYGDESSPAYIPDEARRSQKVLDYKADNPEFVDDTRRIEALKQGVGITQLPVPDAFVEAYVELQKILDKPGIGEKADEVRVFLSNSDQGFTSWIMDKNSWGTKAIPSFTQTELQQAIINVTYAAQDEEYSNLLGDRKEKYLIANPDYATARLQRAAYGKGLTGSLVGRYVSVYSLPDTGYYRARAFMADPELARILGVTVPAKIPSENYDIISERTADDDEIYNALATQTQKDAYLQTHPEYAKNRIRLQGYRAYVPDNQIENFVGYKTRPKGDYEDDWFLMEHPSFYKQVYLGVLGEKEKDFSEVPTRQVYALYQQYNKLPETGKARLIFRHQHLALEDWLVNILGYNPVGNRWQVDPLTLKPSLASLRETKAPAPAKLPVSVSNRYTPFNAPTTQAKSALRAALPKPTGLSATDRAKWEKRLADMEARLAGVQ